MPSQPYETESVSAILFTEHMRFLMQLRDPDKPIVYAGYWGLFGGGVEPGETREAAMRRELIEELYYDAPSIKFVSAAVFPVPAPSGTRWERETYFAVPLPENRAPTLQLREGADKALLTYAELLSLEKIPPMHVSALMIFARGNDHNLNQFE